MAITFEGWIPVHGANVALPVITHGLDDYNLDLDAFFEMMGGQDELATYNDICGTDVIDQYPPEGWNTNTTYPNSGWITGGSEESLYSKGRLYTTTGKLMAGFSPRYKIRPIDGITVTGDVIFGNRADGTTSYAIRPIISGRVTEDFDWYSDEYQYPIICYNTYSKRWEINAISTKYNCIGGSSTTATPLFSDTMNKVPVTRSELPIYATRDEAITASGKTTNPENPIVHHYGWFNNKGEPYNSNEVRKANTMYSPKLMLSASVSDGGTLTAQWYKNGEPFNIEDTNEDASAVDCTYQDKSLTNDVGTHTYHCVLTNTLPSGKSTSVTLDTLTLIVYEVEPLPDTGDDGGDPDNPSGGGSGGGGYNPPSGGTDEDGDGVIDAITGLSVNVVQVSLYRGEYFQFVPVVEGTGTFDKSVSYKLIGADPDGGTTYDHSTGILTIGEGETNRDIRLFFCATADPSHSAMCYIIVLDALYADDLMPFYQIINGVPVKKTCYKIINGSPVLISTAEVVVKEDTATYRWKVQDNALVSVGKNDNPITTLEGGIVNGVFKNARYKLATPFKLLHNKDWAVEWKSIGACDNGGGMAKIWDETGVQTSTSSRCILYRHTTKSISITRFSGSTHIHYGVMLDDHNIEYDAEHIYRLQNKVNADGTNMVWLYVDGEEVAPCTKAFGGETGTSDWVSGEDFSMGYMGVPRYILNGFIMDDIAVWESGFLLD